MKKESLIDEDASLRLNTLRFPLILGVVFIHAYANLQRFNSSLQGTELQLGVVHFIQNLISQGFARIAVPLFFLMSGYLFFLGFKPSRESYLGKLRSRAKTLLVPFLFWNLLVLLFLLITQAVPATRSFYTGGSTPVITSLSPWELLDSFFGLTRPPIAYQFWFIRDLMILIVFSPLLYLLNLKLPYLLYGIVGVAWLVNEWPFVGPSSEATLFFSFGGYLAIRQARLFHDTYGKLITTVYLIVVAADAATYGETYNLYIHKAGVLLGVWTALYASKVFASFASSKFTAMAVGLSTASFFVFAGHEPLLTILCKLAPVLIPVQSAIWMLGFYLLIPIAVAALLVTAHRILTAIAPGATAVVTGGR